MRNQFFGLGIRGLILTAFLVAPVFATTATADRAGGANLFGVSDQIAITPDSTLSVPDQKIPLMVRATGPAAGTIGIAGPALAVGTAPAGFTQHLAIAARMLP